MNYSRIIAGTMSWGNWGKQCNSQQMIRLMNTCLESSVTTFDHADIYGDYTTEKEFGEAFKQSNITRDDIQLISKCGIVYASPKRPTKIKHYNYSRDYIIKSVENSLKNLATDYLDLLLLHRPSPLMEPNEIMEAIAKLGQEGKIKSFGVSNFTTSQVELITSEVPVEVNQIEFSLTHNLALFDGTLDQMMVKKMTPMAWSPLGEVFKNDTEQTRRIHECLGSLLDKYSVSEDQLLLAWILKHPANIHPVVGTTNQTRIKEANNALQINLELEDWFSILVASQGHKVP